MSNEEILFSVRGMKIALSMNVFVFAMAANDNPLLQQQKQQVPDTLPQHAIEEQQQLRLWQQQIQQSL